MERHADGSVATPKSAVMAPNAGKRKELPVGFLVRLGGRQAACICLLERMLTEGGKLGDLNWKGGLYWIMGRGRPNREAKIMEGKPTQQQEQRVDDPFFFEAFVSVNLIMWVYVHSDVIAVCQCYDAFVHGTRVLRC